MIRPNIKTHLKESLIFSVGLSVLKQLCLHVWQSCDVIRKVQILCNGIQAMIMLTGLHFLFSRLIAMELEYLILPEIIISFDDC